MQFGHPQSFRLFAILPAFFLFYWIAFRMRRGALENFLGPHLISRLLIAVSPFKRKLKAALLLFSLCFIILSLAEPKWGFHIEEVKRRGIDLVIALDVSKSMLAEDVKPNRLSRAKLEIESLLNRLPGDRVALLLFAGSAFIQCPLTLDYGAVKLFLEDVTIESIPRGGTNIGGAIQKSIEAFEGEEGGERVILLLTDGEDHGGGLEEALGQAKKKHITIYPVGVGKREGAPIPVADASGRIEYLRSRDDSIVLSKLDPRLLERMAQETGGTGGILGVGDFTLEELYEGSIARLGKGELTTTQKKEYHHRFQWPLAIGFILLYLEGLVSERK